jgi:hypothetical protein
MPNVENIVVSNATATYNAVALPETDGGYEIQYTEEVMELTSDTYGTTPRGAVLIGQRVEVTARFASTTIDTLKAAIATSTKTTGTPNSQLDVGSVVGAELSTATLVITPTHNTDLAITIHKAYVATDLTIMFKFDEKNTYEVKFIGVIDTSKAAGKRLFQIGTASA